MTTLNGQVQKVSRSLKYSILDGAAFSAMLGLTQNYIVPFALALKATTMQVGLLTSIPNLTMALSQLASPRLAERAGSRKGLILPVVLLHALMWLPILLVPYLFPGAKIWWLIVLVTLSVVFGALGNPAWGSLMADLVPGRIRGRYFGARGRIAGFVTLVFSVIGGLILQFTASNVFLGFSVLFGGAMLFRLVSLYYLARMYEPPLARVNGARHRLIDLVKSLGSSNLGRLTIYVALVSFSTNIAAPFFAVYMLRGLQFSYLTYVIITAVSSLSTLLFLTFWGKRADRAGNVKVMRITSVLIPLIPVLWLASRQVYYLAMVETFAGFAWAGFNLAYMNFIYDAAAPEKRTQHIALFNAMNGTAICLGALLGGFIAPHLPRLLGYNLLTLFLISGVLRALVVAILLRRISEVRRVSQTGIISLLFNRHSPNGNGSANRPLPSPHPLNNGSHQPVPATTSSASQGGVGQAGNQPPV
jgi:MFS family permease